VRLIDRHDPVPRPRNAIVADARPVRAFSDGKKGDKSTEGDNRERVPFARIAVQIIPSDTHSVKVTAMPGLSVITDFAWEFALCFRNSLLKTSLSIILGLLRPSWTLRGFLFRFLFPSFSQTQTNPIWLFCCSAFSYSAHYSTCS